MFGATWCAGEPSGTLIGPDLCRPKVSLNGGERYCTPFCSSPRPAHARSRGAIAALIVRSTMITSSLVKSATDVGRSRPAGGLARSGLDFGCAAPNRALWTGRSGPLCSRARLEGSCGVDCPAPLPTLPQPPCGAGAPSALESRCAAPSHVPVPRWRSKTMASSRASARATTLRPGDRGWYSLYRQINCKMWGPAS